MSRLLCMALVVCLILPAAGAAEPELKGTLTVEGQEVVLRHVLVLDFDDTEEMGDGPELRVLFSDTPVAKSELESPVLFNLHALAQAGKMQGVLLRFDPKAETREVYGTSYVTVKNPQTSMPFFTLSGSSGGVDSLKVEGDVLSGSVESSAKGDADFGTPTYAFNVTFTAPIQQATPVTTLKGEEALAAPQMKTLLDFEAAMRAGDLDTVREMTSPEKSTQMDAYIAQVGKEEFLKMVKQMAPEPEARKKGLRGLYTRGDRTTAVFDEEGGKTSMTLIKKGEGWILE